MLSVVTMLFRREPLRKSYQAYTVEHVNTLARMVARHLTVPYEFVCLTNITSGLDSSIRVAPVETRLIPLGNAYPKLALFKAKPPGINGTHAMFLDLDVAVTQSLDPLVAPLAEVDGIFLPEFCIPSRSTARQAHYNTSVFAIKVGAFPHVWDRFDPAHSPIAVRNTGKIGSDQVWASMMLGAGMPTWPAGDAILSYKYDVRGRDLPASARVICFHGKPKPWDADVQGESPWIKSHWR